MNFCWNTVCYWNLNRVEDGKGSEASMKGFAIKASISEIVSLGEEGEKTVPLS